MLGPGSMQTKLVVNDLDRCAEFYMEVIGLSQLMRFRSTMNRRPMEEVMLGDTDGQSHPLVLIRFLDGDEPTHSQVVLVFFTDNIDAFVDRVERCGGQVNERREEAEHKAQVAFWHDLEGNLVETVQLG